MRRRARPARALTALVLLVAMLALAACGSSDGSGDKTTTDGANSAAASGDDASAASATSDAGVKYSQCMRENGVKDFPDPQNGRLRLQAGPGSDLDPESPTFKAAEKACRSLAPSGGPSAGGGAQDASLKFAQCMRENGVPKFPDPETDGGKVQMKLDPSSGIDPNSSSFKAAQAKCGDLLGGGAPQQGTAAP